MGNRVIGSRIHCGQFTGNPTTISSVLAIVFLALCALFVAPLAARAEIPGRVQRPAIVLFKTGAYGTATGAVFGAAGAAFFGGGLKTFGKVTSIGLYTGLLYGLYVLIAPSEYIYGEPSNQAVPPKPQRWREEDEQSKLLHGPGGGGQLAAAAPQIWAPVLHTTF